MQTDLPDAFSELNLQTESRIFHPFSRLPSELRLKIWGHTSPEPCVIFWSPNITYRHEFEEISNTFLAVIHTCREARNEFLEELQPAASTTSLRRSPYSHPRYQRPDLRLNRQNVYLYAFVSDLDTVDISPPHFDFLYSAIVKGHEVLDKVRHISTGLIDFYEYYDNYNSGDDNDDSDNGDGSDRYTPQRCILRPEFFPKLESFTFRLDPDVSRLGPGPAVEAPLQDQLLFQLKLQHHSRMKATVAGVKRIFAAAKEEHPDWRFPLLKFRDDDKFLADPSGSE